MGKTILKIVLVIAIIATAVYFIAYNKSGKTKKPVVSQQEKDARINEFLYREDAVLLAIKYKVDEEKVFNLLVDINDLATISEEWTKERIRSLSEKYGIPDDKIVDIILNFRIEDRLSAIESGIR